MPNLISSLRAVLKGRCNLLFVKHVVHHLIFISSICLPAHTPMLIHLFNFTCSLHSRTFESHYDECKPWTMVTLRCDSSKIHFSTFQIITFFTSLLTVFLIYS